MTAIEALEPAAPTELRIRGRSIMAIVLAPAFPIGDWFAALDKKISQAPDLIAGRPVVVDLSGVMSGGPEGPLIVLDGLEARDLKLVGVEGVGRMRLAGTRWSGLARVMQGRDVALQQRPRPAPAPAAPPPSPSLLIDRPVRSGQSVVFEHGDVTIVGALSSGAEVIAGGSIHVYGSLRGRAVAGVKLGEAAAIFCRKLEAEMVGIDRVCRTADTWGPKLHGKAAQVRCHGGRLQITPLA